MKTIATVLLVALAVTSSAYTQEKKQPSGFDKIVQTLFPSAKPKPTPKPRKRKREVTRVTEQHPLGRKIEVTPEWMARYWELEAAWDYPIPDDDLIEWKDGQYRVNAVVFKHYEDMANTPRRAANP